MALRLHREGIPIVGVPKTIDNDLGGTDVTFGFHTAVQIVTDAIDRLHTTAESHNRVMVVEVMGRHTGWIATYAGLAGGADAILVPERPFDIDQDEGWQTILFTTPSEKPLRNPGSALSAIHGKRVGPLSPRVPDAKRWSSTSRVSLPCRSLTFSISGAIGAMFRSVPAASTSTQSGP